MMPAMSKSEREALAKLIRQRAALGKKMVDQRGAELMADYEAQSAAIYKSDAEAWRDITAIAKAAARKADAVVAKVCRERGIPEEFRPVASFNWYGRGENALASRRAELRKVAQTRIEAMKREAVVRIETVALEGQTLLVKDGLETAEAQAFLASMPTVEALMPKLDAKRLTSPTAPSSLPAEEPKAAE
jgi:hypothetical protein